MQGVFRLELFDLAEIQFDGCVSTKDIDKNLELLLVWMNLFDLSAEVAERTLDNSDGVSLLPSNLGSFFAGLKVGHDPGDFVFL